MIFHRRRKTAKRTQQFHREPRSSWSNMGMVYSPKTRRYTRIGSSASFKIIRDDLVRNKEWYKRVQYMAQRDSPFANKLKELL